MASGASSTLTKELRIELKFVTTKFLEQIKTAAGALDTLNGKLVKTKETADGTQQAFRQLAQDTRAVGSKENTVTFQQNAKALREVSQSAKGAKTSLNQYSTAATKAASKSNKISSGFGGVGTASTKAKNAVQGLTTALGGFITIQSARSALNNALAFDRVENRMRAATNSTEEYNEKTKLASSLADELGVDLLAASRGFATLTAATRGSGVEGAVTDQLFESILKTSAALSLTADETNSVILAFGQVASKGRAAAEEIRGQIGERIPGFYTKLAEALGKTQAELTKLLDQGLLSSDEALKASAVALDKAFGQKALDNAQSATAQYNRIVNEIRQAGNESARWLANNSAIVLSIRKIGEVLAANRQVRESDSDLVNKSIEITEKRIAQLEVLRKQGEITNKEARAGILKAINDQERQLRGVEKTKDQLKELERVRSFINDGTFDAVEAESNLLDITHEYLKNEREITKEKQKQAELDREIINLRGASDIFNVINKGYDLISKGAQKAVEEANKLPDPLNKLAFLTDEQQLALAEQSKQYTLQRNADKDRLKTLQEQLKTLKQQKEALKGGTGKVNFIEAIQAGSAASIKLGIEARARATGAVDSNKELLQEIDLGIKRVGDEIEELKNNLKVENA